MASPISADIAIQRLADALHSASKALERLGDAENARIAKTVADKAEEPNTIPTSAVFENTINYLTQALTDIEQIPTTEDPAITTLIAQAKAVASDTTLLKAFESAGVNSSFIDALKEKAI